MKINSDPFSSMPAFALPIPLAEVPLPAPAGAREAGRI